MYIFVIRIYHIQYETIVNMLSAQFAIEFRYSIKKTEQVVKYTCIHSFSLFFSPSCDFHNPSFHYITHFWFSHSFLV